jgi:hypothetical protein
VKPNAIIPSLAVANSGKLNRMPSKARLTIELPPVAPAYPTPSTSSSSPQNPKHAACVNLYASPRMLKPRPPPANLRPSGAQTTRHASKPKESLPSLLPPLAPVSCRSRRYK